jgi:ribosomal protein S18 acetylase RimI-like enzyme
MAAVIVVMGSVGAVETSTAVTRPSSLAPPGQVRERYCEPVPVELSDLEAAHAGEALTLQRAAYVTEAQAHDDPRLPPLLEPLETLRAELADPGVVAIGARDGGRLVGVVRLRRERDDPGAAELRRLAVAPDRQGEGIGTRLLLAAEARAPAGVTVVRLFTGEHSAGNIRLYRRHGYRETHRAPAGTHALVFFEKALLR